MSNPVRPLKQSKQFLCTVALLVVQKKYNSQLRSYFYKIQILTNILLLLKQ